MTQLDSFLKKHYKLLFSIIIISSALMYLLLLGGRYIWADESYTFALIRHSYSEICTITAADVHPPLYYILLKFLTQPFDYSLACARLCSIIPYILILIIGGIQLKKLFDEKMSLTFMLLFLLFPFLLSYATEVRMYSLAALFVFANGLFAYKCYEKNSKRDWIIFVISGTGACYTHYFAMVSVGIVYLLLLIALIIKKKAELKLWLISAAATLILYLPWLKFFIGQLIYKVNNDYWIRPITLKVLMDYIRTLFHASGMALSTLYFCAVCLVIFLCTMSSHNRERIILSLCSLAIPVGTVLFGITVSLLIRPVFIIRYILPSTPFFIIFMAIGICQIRREALLSTVLTILFICGTCHYKTALFDEYTIVDDALDQRFTGTYSFCDAYMVLTSSSHIPDILAYYETEKPIYRKQPVTSANPFENVIHINEFDSANNLQMIVFVDVDSKPPDGLEKLYQYDYIQRLDAYGDKADAYLLTLRSHSF